MSSVIISEKNYQNMLIRLGLITEGQLAAAVEKLKGEPGLSGNQELDLVDHLIRNKQVTKDQIIPILEYCRGIPYEDLSVCSIDPGAVKLISESIAKKHSCIPVGFKAGRLHIVMGNPLNIVAQEDIKLLTGHELDITWDFYADVANAVNIQYVDSEMANRAVEEMEQEEEVQKAGEPEVENEEVTRSPVVRLLSSIFTQAVKMGASDIHIEPTEANVRVRFRVDGDMKEIMSIPKASQAPLIARVKIMSSLDIAEKRLPQDGRIEIPVDKRPIDFRVSILPTVHGEKIVLRILDRASVLVTKEKLGFTPRNIERFDRIIKSPEGIILLSGPTGSGKTTTLYAVLAEINSPRINIVTVEDPVEYRIGGIHQVQVNTKAGLTFAAGLRSILRQDPDVIMVGEIRDAETAEIAARAAITGHVVLSTIHTNDAVSTVYRLVDMGVELYMVASALMGVVAQRLVKKLCPKCKSPRETTASEQSLLGIDEPAQVFTAKGCNACGGMGYSGRTAIHEIFVMDRELRNMIVTGASSDAVKQKAREKGLMTLRESCRELVLSGVTTLEEMARVTYSVDE